MTVTSAKLIVGEPGTGKTYNLSHLAKKLVQKGESVHVVCPTKSARDNVKSAYDEFLDKQLIDPNENFVLKSSTEVLHGYVDSKATNLIIEEAGLIEVTVLHGLLHIAQIVPNVHIYMFGDIKQLQPVQGTSIIEKIIRVNELNGDTPFWEWVAKCAYTEIEEQELQVPYDWQLPDLKIEMNILRKNYRLNKQGFNSYNDEYYDYQINNTTTKDDYSEELKYAMEHDYLIISPTKDRGKQVNDFLSSVYRNAMYVAPFIIIRNEIYLNPFHKRYSDISEKFYFMKKIKKEVAENIPGTKWTAFITTHQAQGATVDAICYYMGNKKIWKTHKNHYNNNQLYTAVTRSRNAVMLLGLSDSFKEMREIYPSDAKENLGGIRKKAAMEQLIEDLTKARKHPEADAIYDMFNFYMTDDEIISEYELKMLNYYKVPQEAYSQRYVVSQVNRRVKNIEGFSTLGKWLSDNASKANSKNAKAPRKGKVKAFIDSLDDDVLKQIKIDLSDKKIKADEFKSKYNFTKSQLRRAI